MNDWIMVLFIWNLVLTIVGIIGAYGLWLDAQNAGLEAYSAKSRAIRAEESVTKLRATVNSLMNYLEVEERIDYTRIVHVPIAYAKVTPGKPDGGKA